MCAMKTEHSLSDTEFDSFIKELEQEDCVISAMRDSVMQLD